MNLRTVSIIIPCYNDGKYLPEAIASAKRQTYPNIEIIVVDDHSTDPNTQVILLKIAESGLSVLQTPPGKKGLPAARNAGIARATGKYILPLDADDKIDPTYVSKAVAVLSNNADVAVCGSQVKFFGLHRHIWIQPGYSYEALVLEEYKLVCSCMYRRNDWERVGGYDESLILGKEDMAFWLDVLHEGGRVVILPEPLFFYRIKPHSMCAITAKAPTEQERLAALYRARPEIFRDHALGFMQLCAAYRDERARHTCLFSWKLLAPLFQLEWYLRQQVKRLFGRA